MEYSSRQMHCGWHEQATVQCSIVNAITTGCLSHRMTAGGAAKLSCGATATCSMSGSHAVVASLAWGGDRVGSEHQPSLHTCFCIVPRCGLVSESCLAFNGRSSCLQLRTDTYNRLTPVQQLQVARHPNRPTFLDIALNITDKFVELHGDRAGLDDPAMVAGIGSIDGVSFMMIGHQKGRNTKARGSKAKDPNIRICSECHVYLHRNITE